MHIVVLLQLIWKELNIKGEILVLKMQRCSYITTDVKTKCCKA